MTTNNNYIYISYIYIYHIPIYIYIYIYNTLLFPAPLRLASCCFADLYSMYVCMLPWASFAVVSFWFWENDAPDFCWHVFSLFIVDVFRQHFTICTKHFVIYHLCPSTLRPLIPVNQLNISWKCVLAPPGQTYSLPSILSLGLQVLLIGSSSRNTPWVALWLLYAS